MGTTQRMMTRKKTKKKRFDLPFVLFRHPLTPFGHLTIVRFSSTLIGLMCLAGASLIFAPAGGAQSAGSSHAHDYVIFATVFNDRGFALSGARARVRRAEEKKFRWEAESDHQGELALRVPPGAAYELTIEARGFKTQTRQIDTRQDNRTDLTIRMEPRTEPGTGGKS